MVSIAAGSNDIFPWSALVFGFTAGLFTVIWSAFLLHWKIDDPLDAVAGRNPFK